MAQNWGVRLVEKINLLPKADLITVNERHAIDEIDELISKLHFLTRNDISNILMFDIAKDQVEYLEEEIILNQAAQEVIDIINQLPNIDELTLEDAEAVEAARLAYDAMLDGAKYKVINYSVLVELEYVIETLKEFQNFDPRDVLNCISDVLTSNTNDLVIEDVGFIKITNGMKVKVYYKDSINIRVRDNLI